MVTRRALWEIAVEQYGYFTVRDAIALGIDRRTVDKLSVRGTVERVAHGVYRFPEIPATDRDPLMLALLWTGAPEACLSHDTALADYEVCDVNPTRIHVTVASSRRIRRRGGEFYQVHYADLTDGDLRWWEGMRTVTLPVAIGQCIASGVPSYLLNDAIRTGQARGALSGPAAASLTHALGARDGR